MFQFYISKVQPHEHSDDSGFWMCYVSRKREKLCIAEQLPSVFRGIEAPSSHIGRITACYE